MTLWPIQDVKAAAQRSIHDTFAVPAFYTPGGFNQTAVAVTVRLITAQAEDTDLRSDGYASLSVPNDKLIFSRDEITAASIILQRGDKVVIPSYGNLSKTLDNADRVDSPIDLVWNVT